MKIRFLFIGILLTMTQGAWANGGGDGFVELVAASIGDDGVEAGDGARTCVNRFEG